MDNNIANQSEQTEEPMIIFLRKYIYPCLPKTKKEFAWLILTILIVCALCMFIFNQFVSVKYKVELIQNACWNCENQGNTCTQGNRSLAQAMLNQNYKIPPINFSLSPT